MLSRLVDEDVAVARGRLQGGWFVLVIAVLAMLAAGVAHTRKIKEIQTQLDDLRTSCTRANPK